MSGIGCLTSHATIFQSYVTAYTCRCAGGLKKKFDLWSGSQRYRHFVGFFNVSVQAPTRGQPRPIEKPSYLVSFYVMLGIRRVHSRLNPWSPRENSVEKQNRSTEGCSKLKRSKENIIFWYKPPPPPPVRTPGV